MSYGWLNQSLRNVARRKRRREKKGETFVVIYDVPELHGEEHGEQYYGYFGHQTEALRLFNGCFPTTDKAHNAFLCRIISRLRPDVIDEPGKFRGIEFVEGDDLWEGAEPGFYIGDGTGDTWGPYDTREEAEVDPKYLEILHGGEAI